MHARLIKISHRPPWSQDCHVSCFVIVSRRSAGWRVVLLLPVACWPELRLTLPPVRRCDSHLPFSVTTVHVFAENSRASYALRRLGRVEYTIPSPDGHSRSRGNSIDAQNYYYCCRLLLRSTQIGLRAATRSEERGEKRSFTKRR